MPQQFFAVAFFIEFIIGREIPSQKSLEKSRLQTL